MPLPKDPVLLLSVVNMKLRDFIQALMRFAMIWIATERNLKTACAQSDMNMIRAQINLFN